MAANPDVNARIRAQQIAKYGGEEGYRAEMRRRRAMRKDYSSGHKYNSKTGAQAASKRWGKQDERELNE